MITPLIKKFERRFVLSDADRVALESLDTILLQARSRKSFLLEGDSPEYVHVVHSGFACRYKAFPDGSRMTVGFLIPGDICDLNVSTLGIMDHSIRTLSECEFIQIPREALSDLMAEHPTLDRAFRWVALLDESILREWLISSRRRSAEQQVAHLFCEFLVRLQAIGVVDQSSYHLPLTQADLSDATGLTTVHVNRMLQRLRREELIEFKEKNVHILNIDGLMTFADFRNSYLFLDHQSFIA